MFYFINYELIEINPGEVNYDSNNRSRRDYILITPGATRGVRWHQDLSTPERVEYDKTSDAYTDESILFADEQNNIVFYFAYSCRTKSNAIKTIIINYITIYL